LPLDPRVSRAAWVAVRGVVSGFLYYIVYVVALPILASAMGTPQAAVPAALKSSFLIYLGVMTALGVGAALARGTPAAVPANMLVTAVGWLISYKLLSGGILHGSLEGYTVSVDVRPILYAVLVLGLLYSLASGLESSTSSG